MVHRISTLSVPRHASLCLLVGSGGQAWECLQGELGELNEDGACIVLDADVDVLPSEHGQLSLEDGQGHFEHGRSVQVLWNRRELGHSCIGLRFTEPSPVSTT